jgi:hypothetical protein
MLISGPVAYLDWVRNLGLAFLKTQNYAFLKVNWKTSDVHSHYGNNKITNDTKVVVPPGGGLLIGFPSPGPSNNLNPHKRPRKSARFCVARSTSALQVPDQSISASKSSLFITITQPDKCGPLKTQGRILSGAAEHSDNSSVPSSTSATGSNAALELHNDDAADSTLSLNSPQVELPDKPKRTRQTKNSVCCYFTQFPSFLS